MTPFAGSAPVPFAMHAPLTCFENGLVTVIVPVELSVMLVGPV